MEKPAVRVWRRRMGTAYILFEKSSKQYYCEGQGRSGLEGSAQALFHPKCRPVLYRNFLSKESLSPLSLVPKTGMLPEEQEMPVANEQ